MRINAAIAVFLSMGTLCFGYTLTDTDVQQIVHAPTPDLINLSRPFVSDPVSSFLERNSLDEEAFALSVLEYTESKLHTANLKKAAEAISMLTRMSDTLSVPYLLNLVKSSEASYYPSEVLYVLAVRGDERAFSVIQDKLHDEYSEEFREVFYRGDFVRLSAEVRSPIHYTNLANAYWFEILTKQLYEEPSIRLRLLIDGYIDSGVKGWRYSEQRMVLLEKWRKEAESEQIKNIIQHLLDKLHKDLSSGKTNDIVLCEGILPIEVETVPLPDFVQSPSSNEQSTRVPPTDSPAGSTTVSHRRVVLVVAVGMMAVGMIVFGLFRRNKKRKY